MTTALKDTTNANYTLLIKDIDIIAVQLNKLEAADVPVLFRPLHEAEGKWFWWGAQGPEPAKKLWNIVYDRITNYHKINNLLWVWNSVAADCYHGSATVDVVSADTYTQGDHGIIAAEEIGSVMDPAQLKLYQADWVYFVVWSGDFISGDSWKTLNFLKSVYTSDYVLTLDEIQGWKSGGTPPVTSTSTTRVSTTTARTSTTSLPVTLTTLKTSTTTKVSSSAAPTGTGLAQQWAQCGGNGYSGPTICASPDVCTKQNDWYRQCL